MFKQHWNQLKMKEKFKGFYSPKSDQTDLVWNSPNTMFIFDANCLLNLYKCEPQTRDDIFAVMEAISGRSWFPFQTCFEYQRGRVTVINESIKKIKEIKDTLKKIGVNTENALSDNGVKIHLYTRLAAELKDFQETINKPLNDFINTKIDPRLDIAISISDRDIIRDRIDSIVQDRCGDKPTQEKITSLNDEGVLRYESLTPPGFNDAKKTATSQFAGVTFEDKYGDLYLWKEVLEKSSQEDIKNVILVTDDQKSDWWYIPEKRKPKGPLEQLQTEIYMNSNIDCFKLLTQSSFLEEAKIYLKDIKINDESVKEIQSIQIENRKYEIINKRGSLDFSIEEIQGEDFQFNVGSNQDKFTPLHNLRSRTADTKANNNKSKIPETYSPHFSEDNPDCEYLSYQYNLVIREFHKISDEINNMGLDIHLDIEYLVENKTLQISEKNLIARLKNAYTSLNKTIELLNINFSRGMTHNLDYIDYLISDSLRFVDACNNCITRLHKLYM